MVERSHKLMGSDVGAGGWNSPELRHRGGEIGAGRSSGLLGEYLLGGGAALDVADGVEDAVEVFGAEEQFGAGLDLVGADGAVVGAGDAAQLVQWNADGSVLWTWPVPGPPGSLDEIDRSGTRVYVDRVVRNPGSGKDGLVIAVDLPGD